MEMPGRIWHGVSDHFRYTHNDQEKESEIFAGANSAEYWMYDSRIGRRWEMDPIWDVSQSPYLTFDGNPIAGSDPDGDKVKFESVMDFVKTAVLYIFDSDFRKNFNENVWKEHGGKNKTDVLISINKQVGFTLREAVKEKNICVDEEGITKLEYNGNVAAANWEFVNRYTRNLSVQIPSAATPGQPYSVTYRVPFTANVGDLKEWNFDLYSVSNANPRQTPGTFDRETGTLVINYWVWQGGVKEIQYGVNEELIRANNQITVLGERNKVYRVERGFMRIRFNRKNKVRTNRPKTDTKYETKKLDINPVGGTNRQEFKE